MALSAAELSAAVALQVQQNETAIETAKKASTRQGFARYIFENAIPEGTIVPLVISGASVGVIANNGEKTELVKLSVANHPFDIYAGEVTRVIAAANGEIKAKRAEDLTEDDLKLVTELGKVFSLKAKKSMDLPNFSILATVGETDEDAKKGKVAAYAMKAIEVTA